MRWLADGLENLDMYELMVLIHDVENSVVDLLTAEVTICNTSKPFCILIHEPRNLESIIEMCAIVAGGIDELEN